MFLELSRSTKSLEGQYKALGNIGDILLHQEKYEQASDMYRQQTDLSIKLAQIPLQGKAYNSLGNCYLSMKNFPKALSYYTQVRTSHTTY